jgi:serine/threonine protein kinase
MTVHFPSSLRATDPHHVANNEGTITVPGYQILGELGRGGMGVVYQARHLALQRLVALKMVLTGQHSGKTELTRFHTEAEAIARLQHPNIIQIYEVGEHENIPFFSLEFCPGGSLDRKLGGTPLLPEQAAGLVRTLAEAIHAAHQAGIVHRDLKPANVLLAADGAPKITDFGLARKLDGNPDGGPTQTGTILGTPGYMAPEQASGQCRELGPAADIYALGAILYECLTGRPPFQAATPLETILLVARTEPVPPSQLQPRTSRELETICLKCLQKDPARRYPTALALAEDLGRFLRGEPIQARPIGPLTHLARWCRRNPLVAGLLTLIVLVLVVSLLNARFSQASLQGLARRNQVLLAESLARRLDERLHSDAQAVAILSRLAEVRGLLAAPPGERAALLPPTREALGSILRSNPDFSSAFVLDANGTALASTNPAHPGRNYAFRDYFQEASRGQPFRSKILIGTSTGQAGMYYSAPVFDRSEKVLGVVVIKLEALTVWRIVDSLEAGNSGSAFLVDEDGILIAHSDRSLLYHSVVPLSEETLREVKPRERFQTDTIPDLGIRELHPLVRSGTTAQLEYTSPAGARRVVAYAPLEEKPWVLAVDLDAREFTGPWVLRLWRDALVVVLLVLLGAGLVSPAWRWLRRVRRP